MYRGVVRRCVASATSSTTPLSQGSGPSLSSISLLAQKTREDPIQNGSQSKKNINKILNYDCGSYKIHVLHHKLKFCGMRFWEAFQSELDNTAAESAKDEPEGDDKDACGLLRALVEKNESN